MHYRHALSAVLHPDSTERVVVGRVKSGRSIVRKMRDDPERNPTWDSVLDKVGLRVICSTKADCDAVRQLVHDHLDVTWEDVKSGPSNELFYPGIHMQVQDATQTDPRGLPIPVEIQIRTRAQDAWSVVSHKFLYKAAITSPPRVERMIHRLIVVMEMFDDDVERANEMRQAYRSEDPMLDVKLNAEHLEDVYQGLTDEPAVITDLDVLTQLMESYTVDERGRFTELIDAFVANERDWAVKFLAAHQPGEESFLAAADWLFCTPEVLLVLERASTARWLLSSAVVPSQLEAAVRRVCYAAGRPMPG